MESNAPRFMTIRQVAAAGPLSEYCLRLMEKRGELPCVYSGSRCLVNYDALIDYLRNLQGVNQ